CAGSLYTTNYYHLFYNSLDVW
nr:immunoglobulin heavy chain junction region [Macaca mulatta]MOV53707.1 immunoglobulin heavy chain junction region [Macaca mulatta]MOV54213.1 immunoglobulin heavy chain junction region [Macaca mulatta]MOV54754.1 immunoglobulin heavy chain junction region [Macaca mulatta]MOV54869.1 immunoglobulin heavy chain junction region [Macaca mulatta]